MTFEELLDQACAIAHLPEMARLLLPSTLGDETKRAVMKLSPEELGAILKATIDKINCGSVESVDALVRDNIRG
jgi:hypothetical protein